MCAERQVLVDAGFRALGHRQGEAAGIHQGRFVPPCQLALWGDFSCVAITAVADQAVAVFQTLERGKPRRVDGIWRSVRPIEAGGQERAFVHAEHVVVIGVRWVEEVHGAVGSTAAVWDSVVEHRNLSKVRVGKGHVIVNPMAIVLVEELLVFRGAQSIRFRISPSPEDFARGEIVVVHNPDFVERGHRHHQVLEIRIEVDGVDVKPIARLDAGRAVIEVDAVGGFTDHPKIGLGGVKILNQVVPGVPLPNHIGTAGVVGRELKHHVRPQPFLGNQRGVPPGFKGLSRTEMFPCNGEHVSVRFHFDVVVKPGCAVVQGVRPQHVVVPSSTFHRGASTTCPDGVVRKLLRPVGEDDVAVLLQVGDVAGPHRLRVGPRVHHFSTHVHEVDVWLVVGVKQGVAVLDQIGLVVDDADGVLGLDSVQNKAGRQAQGES